MTENPNLGTVLQVTLINLKAQLKVWLNKPELKSSEISISKD